MRFLSIMFWAHIFCLKFPTSQSRSKLKATSVKPMTAPCITEQREGISGRRVIRLSSAQALCYRKKLRTGFRLMYTDSNTCTILPANRRQLHIIKQSSKWHSCGYLITSVGRISQSVKRLATTSTFRGSNSVVCEIFRTRPNRLWGPKSLLYNG